MRELIDEVVIPNVPANLSDEEIRSAYWIGGHTFMEVQRNLFSDQLDVRIVALGDEEN